MQEDFYQNGYVNLNYINKNTINAFNQRLRDLISDENLWKKKYKFTKDLKFEHLKIENIFYDLLFENDFQNKINQITSKELFLTNIQVRTCFKGLSYMTWHRDTYKSKNKIIGPFMPCYKLMVYPDLYNIKSKEISLIESSHNRLNFTPYHKYLSSFNIKKKDIYNGNTSCTLIDLQFYIKLYHHEDIPRPRIIYNFSNIETIKNYYDTDLNRFYIDKYKKYLN